MLHCLGPTFADGPLRSTIDGLARNLPDSHLITEHDVFFDLARYSRGQSAEDLFPDADELDRLELLSRRLGLGRVSRYGLMDPPPDT